MRLVVPVDVGSHPGLRIGRNLVLLLLAAMFSTPLAAATITVINDDAPGQGFNDDTPRAATGGNPGTTLGARRLFAFNFAADLLGEKIESEVEIRVLASFSPLQCQPDRGTLGRAGPQTSAVLSANDNDDTFFPIALANAISGNDLVPADNTFGAPETDIGAEFNGAIDNNDECLRGLNWYYGVDGDRPPGSLEFLSTITHELTHGLGFIAFTSLRSGNLPGINNDIPGIFDRFIRDLDLDALWPELTAAQRSESATNTGRVVWDGPNTTANGVPSLIAGTAEGQVRLYAPAVLAGGSSISHWDTAIASNALMEPFETGDINVSNGLGLATCLLQDIGWSLNAGTQCPDQPDAGAPALVVSPDSLAFGDVSAGTTDSATITLSNDGSANLVVQDLIAPGTPFSLQDGTCSTGEAVPSGDSCSVTVDFAPPQAGDFSDMLGVATNAENRSVVLTGSGQAASEPSVMVTPSAVDFGSLAVGSVMEREVTVSNEGDAPLALAAITAPSAPFSVASGQDGCSNTTVPAGEQCRFTTVFEPTSAGRFSANVSVPFDGSNVVVSLTGSASDSATAPSLNVAPGSVAFGSIATGAEAQTSVTVSNSGTASLQIQNILTPAAPFSVVSQTCDPSTALPPEVSCSLDLRFAPSQTGVFDDQIQLDSSDGTAIVALSGEATAAAVATVQVEPESLDFGERRLGSQTTRSIVVMNSGEAALEIGTLGPLAAPFALPDGADNCGGRSLAAQTECAFSVSFQPGTPGSSTAELTVPTNDREVSISISGTGAEVAAPSIDVDPETLQFGDVGVGSARSRIVTVRNTGSSALVIGNVPDAQAPVTPFEIVDQDCANRELAIGVACEIEVRLTPQSSGALSDALDIASNDPASPTVVVQLQGTGVADSDTDGVSNVVEDAGPNGGDGNDDNTLDSLQAEVVSLPDIQGDYATLVTDNGTLSDVQALQAPPRVGLPAGVDFANGFFDFTVRGISSGARAEVSIILGTDDRPDSYYKYREQEPGATPAVRFDFDEESGTGARIEENRIQLNIIDGGRGDADLAANGQIVDPGAPGVTDESAPADNGDDNDSDPDTGDNPGTGPDTDTGADTEGSGGGGSGGGCTLSRNPTEVGLLLPLLLFWGVLGLGFRVSRKR